ncbi:MAG: hypothetical protein KatS3mg008_0879 [Acidimicrobiales bacterium]|nr:MAG: hypothetical protein KatS3mg008_0879 [Acidimicrobiales bacterium]
MPNKSSAYLTARQMEGLRRLGDVVCPGDGEFPSFSASGCWEHVDDVLEHMSPADLDQLRLLLTLCSLVPRAGVERLVALAERAGSDASSRRPGSSTLRFMRIGIRGVIFTLYWSGRTGAGYDGPSPLDLIGYDVGVWCDDLGS